MKQLELQKKATMRTRRLVTIPLLATIAFILEYLEFPLPMFPGFLKLDFSTLPGLVGGLMFGPSAGILIELIKNVLHNLLKNTDGLLVGDFASFVAGSCFICTVVLLHRMRQGKGGLVMGFLLGTVLMTLVMAVANVYLLIPAYAVLYQISVNDLLTSFHLDSLWSLVLYAIAPFNVIKGVAISLLAYPFFTKMAPRLRLHV